MNPILPQPAAHVVQVDRVRASLMLAPTTAERHNTYPVRRSLHRRSEVVPGAALAAAVWTIYAGRAA